MNCPDSGHSHNLTKKVQINQVYEQLQRFIAHCYQTGLAHPPGEADLRASCVQCGFNLSAAELWGLAEQKQEELLADPRWSRLQQGYCGKKGCQSYYYEIAFIGSAARQLEQTWDEVIEGKVAAVPALDQPVQRTLSWKEAALQTYGRRKVFIAIAAILTAATLLYLQFRKPSWSTRPSKYQVDPTSVLPLTPVR